MYPTASGSEPQDPGMCSKGAWQRAMQGHAAANLVPVVASNRIGDEEGAEGRVAFYGGSFVADHTGLLLGELHDGVEGVSVHPVDLAHTARQVPQPTPAEPPAPPLMRRVRPSRGG